MTGFVRYQSAVPNRHWRHPGVFALANGLRHDGMLEDADRDWLARANARAEEHYADPTTVAPDCYDPVLHPGARSWFRDGAASCLQLCEPYLALLDRYGVAWVELRTRTPGHVVHEDPVQVVATPFTHPADWPFRTRP
ncbi:hypothetical protein BIU97_04375 [Curtobacterium sp. MCBA15_009]|uniref:hypothetical protein n=1 Tax=Curtobacterium sp. MCBA15_009 TaxID=1898737 RepID=UPI0008DDE452|nr:hypothetical protein [Curtobacterium sp. MCBA15_009]OII12229.1 hypothetical protein BIU97_04375 [Curtobacterium sp. MCBA15_009]